MRESALLSLGVMTGMLLGFAAVDAGELLVFPEKRKPFFIPAKPPALGVDVDVAEAGFVAMGEGVVVDGFDDGVVGVITAAVLVTVVFKTLED